MELEKRIDDRVRTALEHLEEWYGSEALLASVQRVLGGSAPTVLAGGQMPTTAQPEAAQAAPDDVRMGQTRPLNAPSDPGGETEIRAMLGTMIRQALAKLRKNGTITGVMEQYQVYANYPGYLEPSITELNRIAVRLRKKAGIRAYSSRGRKGEALAAALSAEADAAKIHDLSDSRSVIKAGGVD